MNGYDVLQVAKRLKNLREIFEYSIEHVAQKVGVSPKEYMEIEEGKYEVPIGVLYEAALLFNVELTTIITGDAPKLHTYSLVRKGKGLPVERHPEYKYQSLAYNFNNKKTEPLLVTIDPAPNDTTPIALNAHPGQEMDYVIEGKLMVKIAEHEMILEEGDTLYYDSSIPHGMKAIGDKQVKFLAIIIQ